MLNHYCQLEPAYDKWGKPYGDFIDVVGKVIWHAWPLDPNVATEHWDVFQRDRGCTNPICTSRDCGGHHIERRSQGGTEHRWNLTGGDFTAPSS